MLRISIVVGAFAMLMTTTCCNKVIRVVYGLKKPKVENEVSLRKYLSKKDIAAHNIYTVNQEDFKSILALNNNKIPEMMVFNKAGQLIVYREDSTCNAGANTFIDLLHTDREYPISHKTNLSTELDRLRNFDGKPAKIQIPKKTDFIILMNWARYMGRLNKTQIKVWEERAKANDKVQIEVFKVNLDFQEFWEAD